MINWYGRNFSVFKAFIASAVLGTTCMSLLQPILAYSQDQPPESNLTCVLALKHAPETDPKKERTKKCEQLLAKHTEDSAVARRKRVAENPDNPVEVCLQEIDKGATESAQKRFEKCLSQALKKQADKKGPAASNDVAPVPAVPLPTKPPG
jgi:hypothetical protein